MLGLTLLGTTPAVADDIAPADRGRRHDLALPRPDQRAQRPCQRQLADRRRPWHCAASPSSTSAATVPTVLALDAQPSSAARSATSWSARTPQTHGTHVIDYYVCDTHHLVPATLTVEMRTVVPLQVHKVAGKPGRLRVTNKNTAAVRFSYGDPRAAHVDGKVRIPAGSSRVVKVRRHKIVWVAEIGPAEKATSLASPGIAGHGVVRGIKVRPGQELPPPKEHLPRHA